ncbi:MAG: 2-oxo acid dehydrogenase subunit E2, partial [Planctomycetaceae bacterium]|nr:2-oxo acid dehydrogenase subunit E2 [Planctomycetaceae bacterium]
MAMQFNLPEVSEGVTSVDIAEFLVAEGDVISTDTVVCEVETDKAVAEIRCPYAGKVSRILVSSGQSVDVGAPLLEIEVTEGAPASADTVSAPQAPAELPEAITSPTPPAAAASPTVDGSPQIIEFCLPPVSEGVDEVDIAEVLVVPGDVVHVNSVICEVETDKAVAEIQIPYEGIIRAVHIAPGAAVSIGAPLVTIEAGASALAASPTPPTAAPATDVPSRSSAPAVPEVSSVNQVATASAPVPAAAGTNGRPPAPAGPATRRLARKLGVDLYQVSGTARGGRITIEDVEGYVRSRLSGASIPAMAPAPGLGAVARAPLPDFSKFGPIEKQPLNKIFRTAAANLHAAWVTIPHVTQHDLADITELEAARKRYVKTAPNSPKITMTAIMIKAVVSALKAFPSFNSSVDLDSGELILKHYYHIGVAVDTPSGLVVPVIRHCDQKNVLQVAAELSDLAEKARERKLRTEDMQGASFTITNLGGIGGTYFTPIVNHPEVAILGMSRGQKQLVMDEDQVSERLMLPLSLSYDHRAINGADAARFIVKLSSSLSNFFELF